MENTNKKRYWLRGLVAGVVFDLLIVGLFLVWPASCIGLTQDGVACIPPGLFEDLDNRLTLLVNRTAILNMSGLILISSLIGGIYGRFRDRKSAASPSNV